MKMGVSFTEHFQFLCSTKKGELLLQRRAFKKYHSGGLWTNTCCSHPRPGENVSEAAVRRLEEEMGLHCKLVELFTSNTKQNLTTI